MKKFLLFLFAVCISVTMFGQTVLISPTGDGGFETGSTFAANGWTAVNGTYNLLYVGATPVPSQGTNCAFSGTGPTTWANTANASVNHIYRDITVPAGNDILTINFKYKVILPDVGYDYFQIYLVPTSVTPVAGTLVGSGQLGGNFESATAYTASSVAGSAAAGSAVRLVISWRQDGVAAYAAGAIDEISVIASPATTYTASALGGLWNSPASWVGGVVPAAGNDIVIPAGSTLVVNQSVNCRDLTVNGKVQWITTSTPSSTVNTMSARNITIGATGQFYAHATVSAGAYVYVSGDLINNGVANFAAPVVVLVFNGTSGTQTLGGTGTFTASTSGKGMISNLWFNSLAACSITTSQDLVTSNLANSAGSINTNGKLSIDNTAICFGGLQNRSITTVTVNTMGVGYTSAPTIAFTAAPAGGTTATGTANFDAATGTVRSITITNPGDGYRTAPTVTFTGGGYTTTATAVAALYQVFNFGSTSLGQKSAIATISGGLPIKSDQSVGSVWVTNGGLGYTSAPVVGFPLPTLYLNLVTNGGSGYTTAPTVTVTGGGYTTQAVATAVVCQGKVVSVAITSAGAGYTSTPTFVFSGGGGGSGAAAALPANAVPTATATVALGMVTNITVTNGGTGYTAAPTPTLTGGGSTTAASGVTARVGLYNLTLSWFSPAVTNGVHTESLFIPANRRINVLSLNSAAGLGANLTGNLDLYSSAPLTNTGDLNMGGNTLTFSYPTYTGISGTATAFVSNGSISFKMYGSLTAQTRAFPFNSYDVTGAVNHLVSMGTGTTMLTEGSTITTLTGSIGAAPTGGSAGNYMLGSRTWRLQTSGGLYGTAPTVRLAWNGVDNLVSPGDSLYIAQATATTGPWTKRSVKLGGTAFVAATGNRTTGIVAPALIVPTGDDYFGWLSTFAPVPTFVVTPTTLACGYALNGNFTAEKTYTMTGYYLTGSGNVVVTAPTGFVVSLTTATGFGPSVTVPFTGPNLATTTIFVKGFPTSPNTYYTGNITNVGGGASANVAVTCNSDFFTGYCTSIPSSTVDEEIIGVTVNGATNVSNCTVVAPGPGSVLNEYSNFFPLGSLTTINQGSNVSFSIQQSYCPLGTQTYSNGCAIWIDFNQNGSFLDAGEQVFVENATTAGPRTITGSFTIPPFATVGVTAMRIIVAESYSGTGLTPCMVYTWGETEDYKVTIGEGQFGNIQGHVSDCYTNNPIQGAAISIGSPYSDVTTNADGDYLFSQVSIGTWTVHCTKTGYTPKTAPVTVTVSQTSTQDFCLDEILLPPVALQATVVNTVNVHLTWHSPGYSGGGFTSQWIKWDNGTNYDAIGTGAAVIFSVASRWPVADIAPFNGGYLKKVRFYPNETACTYTIKVWKGVNAATLLYSQVVTAPTIAAWNEITLTTPVPIDGTQEFWFGYEVNATLGYPAGCDAGPPVAGKGNMIQWSGVWQELTALGATLTFNWSLQGWVSPTPSASMQQLTPIAQNTSDAPVINTGTLTTNPNRDIIASTSNMRVGATVTDEVGSPDAIVMSPLANNPTGYNVYRDGTLLATNIPDSTYLDQDLSAGVYNYTVKAKYPQGLSPAAGPVQAIIITCFPPTALTVSNTTDQGATISWTPGVGNNTAWVVEWGLKGFVQGTGTLVNVSPNPTTDLSGLIAGAQYDFYVKADCGGGLGISTWAGPKTFRIHYFRCPIGSISEAEPCGADLNGGCNLTPPAFEPIAPGETVCGTSWCSGSSRDTDWFTFTLTAPSSEVTLTGRADFDVLLGFLASPCPQSTFLTSITGLSGATTSLTTTLAAGTYYVFVAPSVFTNVIECGGGDRYKITLTATSCFKPTALAASGIMLTSANIGWTSTASHANIEWGPAGFAPGSGTLISGTAINPYHLTGLTAATSYDFYVQAVCGVDTLSAWSGPANFKTGCAEIVTTTPGTRCGNGSVTLGATGSAGTTVKWFESLTSGTVLGTGTTFNTPSISATTNFYAAAAGSGGVSGNVGKVGIETGAGTGGGIGSGELFTALSDFTLQTIDLFPYGTGAGTVTITLQTAAGVAITSATVNVTGTTSTSSPAQTVTVNFPVTGGADYKLIATAWTGGVTNMYRDITNIVYPYTLPGVVSITASTLAGSYYYFFYNWSVFSGCVSSRVAVTATVTAPVPINVTATPASLCPGQSSVLDVTSADPNYSYIWTPGGLVGPTHTVTPASTTAYTATGSNPINGCVTTATTTVAVNPAPSAITITPAAPIILPGATQQLEASGGTVGGNVVIGTGIIQNTTTSWPAPYGFYYNSSKHQFLILASELTAAGANAGNINSLSFDVVSLGTCGPMPGFTMKMAHSTLTDLTTTFETTGFSTVFGPVTYQPVVGINTHNFTAPFIWNGTSNIIVEVCFSNYPAGYTQNAVMNQTATTFASSAYVYSDLADQCPNTTATYTALQRPNMIFGSLVPTNMTWAPFTALYTDTLTTIPYAGAPATKVFSKPTATITYTATATVPSSGCTTTQNVTVYLPVTCEMPTYTGSDTITTSSASIHWGEPQPAPGSGYEYEVRTSGAAGSGPNGLTVSGTTPLLRVHINGLAPGTTYHLYVRSNCGDNIYSGWTTDHQFTTGTLPLSITGVATDLSCNQSMDGAINTTVTGGLPPYTFAWNTGETTQNISGLSTGTYFVIVTDANFATVSDSWNVLEPLEISWGGYSTNVTCFGAMNGSITTIYTDGGTPPYTYTWSNGQTTPDISGLAPGQYSLTVADAHNCDMRAFRYIMEPAPLMLENPYIIPASCPTGSDGSIEVTVMGGTPPYSFLWSNGATTMNIFGLNPGEYGVVVTDANLCVVSNVYFVGQTSAICATIHVTGNISTTECYNATGTITVAGSGTTFVVYPQGHATFIAGEKIFYKEGTKVLSGGYMLGKITSPTGPFCPVYAKMTEVDAGQELVPVATERAFFNLYPNPTNGNFTLIQKGDRIYNNVKVEVYAMSGEKVLTESIIGLMKHEFRFNDMPSGLYFVRVVADDYVETIKLVKTR